MKYITIHCSATKPKSDFNVERLRDLHVGKNGWSDIGYHFYITCDGVVHSCRPLNKPGAHTKGHNVDNIGVCMEGGINNDTGKSDDTFNSYQKRSLKNLVEYLQESFSIPNSNVKGHRDWSPDLNGDGTIQANEFIKQCPCFSVSKWMKEK